MRTIPEELVKRYTAEGWWTDDSLGDLVLAGLAAAPDATFRVHSEVRPWSGTFGEVERIARRLAEGLRRRGVEPGDVLAFQLPNWMEAAAVFWAATMLGAVVVPVVHIYGRKELAFIIDTVKPKVYITAIGFGRMEFHADLCAGVPITGVVGDDFEDLLAREPLPAAVAVDASAPALIAFTSGTTRNPKGVVHSHRTLGFEARQLSDTAPPDLGPTITAAPVRHFIGMLNAFLMPLLKNKPVTLVDTWDPKLVLSLIAEEGLSVGGGVPYYFTSLLDHPDFTETHLRGMRYAAMGGAAVPAAVTDRLTGLGINAYRAYGSSEHPSITGCTYEMPTAKRLYTDGTAMQGVEFRLGPDGEILSRGPDLCLGYTDPDLTAAAFDDQGWYHTGDIGVLDADGFLTISDRKSDFIIRGGENIGALEVEEVLLTMPGVAEAAVVAAPDTRLGEHVAAVVRLKSGHELPTMAQLRDHCAESGLTKQKWPEELHAVDEFPRTPSGKVQKFRLRQTLRQAAETGNR
ncbi:AMP-binding protein [Nocardia miyunensis]|uniref:AMP-binding protein n=1 Tax=Nocardia miyunensis TaxID=282684 RepID=UPI000829C2B9|nr:AMP-binding protein [Nocardia miyunensis]